ncbi:response regulator [Anaplasma phagocytophilum]|nr:response regulator [Anaplasma phagocytophilum]
MLARILMCLKAHAIGCNIRPDSHKRTNMIQDILRDDNYVTRVAADGLSAMKLTYEREPDVVLLDTMFTG